jgi:ubiquinone/menaquinone biosynthesis C-methylase UbiE
LIKQSDYENYDYRQFWQDDKRLYEDSSERIVIKKFIRPLEKRGRIFVDLGCGFGRLFNEYKDFEKIILVDYSVNNLKNAKEAVDKFLNYDEALMKKVVFVAADVTCLPFKPSFADTAMTVRVMHHIDNVERFINEASRILKPDGYFLVEFANKRNLKNIIKFMFGRLKQSPFDSRPLQIGATILDYHPKFIKSLLRQTGFKILKQVSASNYRLGFLKRHINLKVLLFFENIYQDIFSFIDTGPSIFLKTINVGPLQTNPGFAVLAGSNSTNIGPAGLRSTGAASLETVSPEINLANAKPLSTSLAAANPAGLNSKKSIESFEDLKTYFCCPACRDENLGIDSAGKIKCYSCKREFYIDNGIYVFK